jgi:general bacterial porin, GBP family
MKKTLLAAALIAGYAGAASAQNSVTLYGVVDLGLNYSFYKAGAASTATTSGQSSTANQFGLVSGVQSGSRWGLKGVEDLGNGLKANFVYEQGVNAAEGSGSGFTRQSTLGLTSSSWGAIDLGRKLAPSSVYLTPFDPFGAGFGTAALTTTVGVTNYRLSNMVNYTTPSISGFSASVAYSFNTGLSGDVRGSDGELITSKAGDKTGPTGTTFGQANTSRAVSLALGYANGPLRLAATYDNIQANSLSQPAAEPTYVNPGAYKNWSLAAAFDFKVVNVSAVFAQANDGVLNNFTGIRSVATGGDTNTPSNIFFVPGARTTSWNVGLSAPVGTGKALFSIQQKIRGGTLSTASTGNEFGVSVGYTYPFSKRTNMYASYSYLNNAGMISGASANQINLGVRHLF